MSTAIEPKPFVKWAGGKAKLVPQLIERIPSTWNRETDLYIEPFLGGGALFFALRPKNAVLNDANRHLMESWCAVRDYPPLLICELQALAEQYSADPKGVYYRERAAHRLGAPFGFGVPGVDAHQAASFIFLNKAGFNGLYRVNQDGEFNVPWGKNPKVTVFEEDNLHLCSAALRDIRLRAEDALDPREPMLHGYDIHGALIYCDPPYVPVSKTADFTAYTPGGFTYADQIRLLARATEWRSRGAHVILSQAANESLIEQYRRCGFTCDKVRARRNINSVASKRGCVDEYIIY